MVPIPDERQVVEHARFLRRLVRGVVADEQVAGDVAQETWLAEFERPPPPSFDLAGWLARVARRLVGRMRRSAQRRSAREQVAARPEGVCSTVDLVAREETLRVVTDVVLALDEPYRSAVLLRYYEELTPEQIARRLDAPVATIRSRLQRARERLRSRLELRLQRGLRDALGWIGGLPMLPQTSPPIAASAVPKSVATAAGVAAMGAMIVTTSMKVSLAAGILVVGALCWVGGDRLWHRPAPAVVPESSELPERARARASDSPKSEALAGAVERTELPAASGAAATSSLLAPVDPRLGSILLHVTWEKDGSPAPGRSVRVIQWKAPPERRKFLRKSDGEACIRLEGLEPGSVFLEADLGGGVEVELQAGERVERTLAIPAGYAIRGRVVDLEQRPVAGASIWCSEYFNYENGVIVAVAGDDGRFELPNVPEARYLAAMKAGHAPSLLSYVEEFHHRLLNERERAEAVAQATDPASRPTMPATDIADLELVLLGEGAGLRAAVVDPEGKPAAGAAIRVIGQVPPVAERATDRGTGMAAIAPYDATCDEEGRFEIEALPVGRATIHVLHAGCAPHEQTLELAAKETAEVVIQLAAEGVVTGRVTTLAGEPVAKADVNLDAEYDPLRPSAVTDADGRFALSGLPIGAIGIAARHKEFGKARASLRLKPGIPAVCDLQIDAGRILTGRVVDESGKPAADLCIDAHNQSERFWGQTTTAADGRFRILNCPDVPLLVSAKTKATDWQPLVSVADVRAGGEELQLTLGAAASLHLVVLLPDGGPASVMLTPWLEGQDSSHCHESDPKSGTIDVKGLAPGRYTLSLQTPDKTTRDLGAHVLKGGDQLDLGTIVLQPAGRLKLMENDALASFNQGIQVHAFAPEDAPLGKAVALIAVGEAQEGIALAPGEYVLCARGSDVALCSRRFEVFSGQDATIALDAMPGIVCTVELDLPKDLTDSSSIRGWIEGDDLRAVLPIRHRTSRNAGVVSGTFRLVPGRYRLSVDVDGKWSGDAVLDVAEGATPSATIKVR